MKIAALLLLILTGTAAAQESPSDLLTAAKAHYDGRRYKDARATYEKARATAEAAGETLVAARAKLGLASLKSMDGQYDEGITLAREAQATFEAAGDQHGIAGAFLHLGNLHIGAAKFADAAEYFRKCAAVDGGRKAFCLERLGQCQESLGQYRESLATLREAIAAAIATGNRALHASALAGLGDIYTNQGNAELGVHYQKKSIEMFRELGNSAMASAILNNLGIAYNLMGRSDLALEVYRENLASMERLKYTRGINMSKMNIAATLVNTGRHEEAAPILGELLAAYERFDDRGARDNVLRLLAEVEQKRGNLSGALEYAVKAAAESSDDVKDVWISQALLGQLYRKLGRFDEARTWLSGAIDTIESMHGHSTGGQVHFFDEPGEAYAEMAILMIGAGRVEEAFEFAERYRSRVLIDALRSGPAERSPALTGDERTRERELAERLSALKREALRGASPELSERVTTARREYDAFQQELAAAHPRLRVERGTLQPVTARDAASRLPREAALVEYLVTEEKTYAFVIAGGKIAVRAIDVDKRSLARDAEAFRGLLADRRPDFRKTARSLHQKLIAPVADLLSKRQSWILIPDGPLWNLPFQALLDSRGTYVAEQAAIVYAPSLAAWLEMSGTPHAASAGGRRELLAFGNPTTPAAAAGVEGTRAALAPLPEAETEVKSAARLYGAQSAVYVRDQATEARFKAEAPRYRVLHVAGHGVLNDASPMHSYLLLASGDTKTEDGYLEAGELMQMDLGAELVVLSACDTARGKYAAGEGIIGFSWALFAARCRTQVVSQWKVDSAATSVLMRDFHRNVRGDRTKAASALQKTIVAMLKTKQYRHPFHWAGFVVLGDAL
jgi:CHAT domain-containing protein/tetratricopeptide (TPR) repeat protein